MNPAQARQIIKDTFTQPFDRDRFGRFTANLLNHVDGGKKGAMAVPDAFAAHVKSCQRLASFTDPRGELLDVLVVNVSEDYKIERTRTALRDFVAHKLKRGDNYKEAALVAFVPPDARRWRLSYVRMQYETVRDPKTGVIKPEERPTPARRFSYLVGEGESCHTAQTRFLELLQDTATDPSLAQIEEAFSVEAVTKEFFGRYADLFGDINAALEKLVTKDKTLRDEFKAKSVHTVDFAKKLMGQIVFLYFLQKKGWLGVEKGKDWGTGPRDFLRKVAQTFLSAHSDGNLFNDVFEPLFYDTLATDRGLDAWCNRFKCRIPFLNGGLFEPLADYDWKKTDVILPNRLFTNDDPVEEGITGTGILDVFDRYNFTVNEAEPLEKEVAIDPEMLGKVFENLIEENRRKGLGAFYTPREIVHYMCQESLINYLDGKLNRPEKPIGATAGNPDPQMSLYVDSSQPAVVPVGQQEFADTAERALISRKDLEEWIRHSDQFAHYAGAIAAGTKGDHYPKPAASIRKYSPEIDQFLRDITVCDPAVGSGAFPVGMMTEIVRARAALTPYFNDIGERTPYHFKRHAIQNCLYGVDIDSSAVDIAKLRLWLSLVVDEEDVKQVKPLPNLDYKIVVGNSLLGVEKDLFNHEAFRRLEALKPRFFDQTDATEKAALRRQINDIIHELTNGNETFDFEIYFSEVFHGKNGFDVCLGNPPYGVDVAASNARDFLLRHPVVKRIPDSYCCFIIQCFVLLRTNGVLSLIVPNTFCDLENGHAFRRHLLQNTGLIGIWQSGWAFEAAVVDTLVFLARKAKRDGESFVGITVDGNTYSRRIDEFLSNKLAKIDYRNPPGKSDLLRKVLAKSIALGDIAEVKAGVKMYEKGKGQPPQTAQIVAERPYSVDGKHPSGWMPLYRGSDVGRYSLKRSHEFVKYGPWLAAPRTPELFDSPKVLMRRTDDRLRSCIEDCSAICVNSCHVIKLKARTDSRVSYNFLVGILNARITQYVFEVSNPQMVGKVFAEIKVIYVARLPIPIAPSDEQMAVERLVDRILAAKKTDRSADTTALEHEIDQIVYRLYDLTPDEIAQIEGALANTRRGGGGGDDKEMDEDV